VKKMKIDQHSAILLSRARCSVFLTSRVDIAIVIDNENNENRTVVIFVGSSVISVTEVVDKL